MPSADDSTDRRLSETDGAPWQRLIRISAGLVWGASIIAMALAGAFFWYSTRPTAVWNRGAITATFDRISVARGAPLQCYIEYTVENHTELDYQLVAGNAPYNVIEGEALQRDATVAWERGTAIHAGRKSRARIKVALTGYSSGDIRSLNAFLNRRFSSVQGFAVLDGTRRYDIRFPKPTRTQVAAIDPARVDRIRTGQPH